METAADPRRGQKREASYTYETRSKKRKDYDDRNIPDNGNENTKSDLLRLPDEVLIEIVKFVSVRQWPYLEKVSRRFRKVVFEAWRSLKKIRFGDDFLVDSAKKKENKTRVMNLLLKKLIRRAPNTTSITGFSNIVGINFSNLASIRWLCRFRNLRSVDFSETKMRSNVLANFLETSASRGRLKELAIGTLSYYRKLLSSAFGNENSKLPVLKLENFSLDMNWMFEWRFLNSMDVSQLTTFNVSGYNIGFPDLISLITRATNLTNLAFGYLATNENGDVLLAKKFQLLKAIATSNNLLSLKISPGSLSPFGQLKAAFVAMIAELGRRRRLEELCLLDRNFCIDEIVSTIADNMSNLKSLELAPHNNATKAPLIRLIKNSKQLEKLRLELHFGRVVDDEMISTIAANLSNLKCFHLIYAISIEEKLTTLKDLAVLDNLKELRVENVAKIDKPTMIAWSDGFGSNLETLEFLRHTRITKKGLVALVDKAPRLRKLALGEMTSITDRRLRAIATSCRDLRELNLTSYKQKMTVDGVQAIVDGCPRLERILGIYPAGEREKVKFENYRKMKFD